MSQSQSFRATIPPIEETHPRPRWSVMIPTYNCAHYLRETLASVLAQDPGSDQMQIEVIDDHSTQDDPAAVVQELGQGRVSFYRQPKNVGYIQNFATCLTRSRGHLVHLLHGDDRILPGFYQKLQQGFDQQPDIGAAFCRHLYMDECGHWSYLTPLAQAHSGILDNGLERIASQQMIQTPSIVVRRSVYETLGGFDSRITCNGEDWEMWVRIAAQYPVWYETEPLALYRQHANSLSGNAIRTGQNIRDLRQVIAMNAQYLSGSTAQQISNQALDFYASEALRYARELMQRGDRAAACHQIQEALKCRVSPKVILATLKLMARLPFQTPQYS